MKRIKSLTISLMLITILATLMSGIVFSLEDYQTSYWKLNNLIDQWDGNSLTKYGATGESLTYPIFNTTGNGNPNSNDFAGVNDYLEIVSLNLTINDQLTINTWINYDTKADNEGIWQYGVDPGANQNYISLKWHSGIGTDLITPIRKDSGDYCFYSIDTAINTGTWYMITLNYNGTSKKAFIDGLEVTLTQQACTNSTINIESINDNQVFMIGRAYDTTNYNFDGRVDETSIYNSSLTNQEILNLYNYGTIEPTPSENSSTERTFIFEQIGATTINSANFITIMNNTFNITTMGDSYFGYRLTVDSSTSTKMECQILIDGNDEESPINRSTSSNTGTMYVVSQPVNLSVGEHWSAFQCKRLGGGNIQVSNIYGVGHYLIDENNQSINNNHIHLENITVNSDSFVSIGNVSLITTSQNLTEHNRSVVFNWGEEIIHTDLTEGITLIQVNGINCSIYPRFGSIGTSGNVAGDCVAENVNASTNVTFNILFKGNSTIAHFHGVIKELTGEPFEIISLDLTGINITSSTLTKVANITFINDDHPSHGLFVKAGIPIKSNAANTDSTFQIRISGTQEQNGTIYTQLAQVNNTVAIIQNIFQNLSIGSYQVELWASCDNSDCMINGGDLVAYVTDTVEATPLTFEVRAFDNFDNLSISNFSVAVEGGLTFSTTSGIVDVFHSGELGNLTLTSGFNGGYFSVAILNHNVSNDLNQTMNQTLINWNCFAKVSGDGLNCTNPLETVFFNYNVIGNPYIQSLNVSNYFERLVSFNVSALQNITFNATNFYSTNLSVRSISDYGSVTTCDYDFSGITYPSYSEGVSGSPNSTIGLINGSYSVLADCVGFANQTLNLTVNETLQNLTFSLFTENSMFFTIYNASDFSLLNTTTVTIDLHGSTVDYSFSTSNGTLFVDGLNADTYTITFTSAVTSPAVLYGTLISGDHLSFDVYLENNLVSKDFIVKDTLANFLGDVILTFIQTINGSEVTIGQATTDFSGRASIYLNPVVEYNFFAVKDGFDVFTGSVTPSQSEYNVLMTQTGLERFISAFEDIVYFTGMDYVSGNNYASPYLIINSIDGSLQYYGINTTYNSVNYFVNNTGTPAGGIEELNITPLVDAERFITVTYFFKATGYDLITWDVPFYLINLTPTNMTFSEGLFDDVEALPDDDPRKLGIGMFIIIVIVLMFRYGSSGDFSAMVVGAMLGLGVCYLFGLFPIKLLSVSMITLGVMLIADNVGGWR